MKTLLFVLTFFVVMVSFLSCEKDSKDPDLNDFCSIKPDGWDCEIIKENFDVNDIPKNSGTPVAIIKYKNPGREFTTYAGTKAAPSLVLDFYPIGQKDELLAFIKSQQLYSWCVPVYYGETEDYFILTSPCFINGGSFTDSANSSVNDLQEAIKRIISVKNYDLAGI